MIGKAMRLTTVCTLAFAICGKASRGKVAPVSEGTQSEPQALLEEQQRLETPFTSAARGSARKLAETARNAKEYGARVLEHRVAVGKAAGGLAVGYAGFKAAGHEEALVRPNRPPAFASERIAKWAERLERESRDAADETLLMTTMSNNDEFADLLKDVLSSTSPAYHTGEVAALTNLMLKSEFPEVREVAALALGEIAKDAKWKHDSPEMTALRTAAHAGGFMASNALQEIFSTPQNAAGNAAAGNDEDRRLKGLKEQLTPDDEDADLLKDLSSSTSSAAHKEYKLGIAALIDQLFDPDVAVSVPASIALEEIGKDAKWKDGSPEINALIIAALAGHDEASNTLQEIRNLDALAAAGNDAAGDDAAGDDAASDDAAGDDEAAAVEHFQEVKEIMSWGE